MAHDTAVPIVLALGSASFVDLQPLFDARIQPGYRAHLRELLQMEVHLRVECLYEVFDALLVFSPLKHQLFLCHFQRLWEAFRINQSS